MNLYALLTLIFLGTVAVCRADTIQATYTATGNANPTPISRPVGTTVTNGDFTVRSCCGDSTLFNATEEYVHWDYILTSNPDWLAFDLDNVLKAEITMTWRTGGDTPRDDWFQMDGGVATPFGFTSNNRTYTRTFNLLSLYGPTHVANSLSDGFVRFRTSNDSFPYAATLRIEAVELPEPDTAILLMLNVLLFALFARSRTTSAESKFAIPLK